MQFFKQISELKRPSMSQREEANVSLHSLMRDTHGEHYQFAADALGMVDLAPQALGVEPDAIRVILGGFSLFRSNREHTLTAQEARARHSVGRSVRPLPVSAVADNVARFIMAVFTGVLLLVPVIALSYISPTSYRLMATCLFVLAFAVIASVGITSTTNERVAATATYAAVLVVFLGQISPPHG